jgi:hypothetical protein
MNRELEWNMDDNAQPLARTRTRIVADIKRGNKTMGSFGSTLRKREKGRKKERYINVCLG